MKIKEVKTGGAKSQTPHLDPLHACKLQTLFLPQHFLECRITSQCGMLYSHAVTSHELSATPTGHKLPFLPALVITGKSIAW